jgi:hypothetical protein
LGAENRHASKLELDFSRMEDDGAITVVTPLAQATGGPR